jgi:hypothetical protein
MGSYEIEDEEGNNNGLPDYNESIDLTVEMENFGIEDAIDVMINMTTNDPYITITDYSELYPVIPAGGTLAVENAFAFSISSDVPDQHPVTFNLTSNGGDETWESVFIIKINAPILHINSITVDDIEAGNGDGELDPGEWADLIINYSNTGHANAYDVDVHMEGRSGFTELTNPLQNFSSIGFFDVFNKTFTVIVDEEAPEGIKVDFVNEMTMGDFTQDRVFPMKISAKCEDFETGDLSLFNWQTGGNAPWEVIREFPYEGYYSIRSGSITHSQTSEISLTYHVMNADSIIFFRKVSSESSDRLKFFINSTLMDDWSGNTEGWKREAFAVGSGITTFKWVYEKNNLGSGGSDCAWLDFIVLPTPMVLTLWAGPDDKICTGNSYPLNESYGTDYTQVEWATSGSGTFDDNTIIHPVYNPSNSDLDLGEVLLTLTLWDDQGTMVTDEVTLGFNDVPAAPGIPTGPGYVNLAEVEISEYTIEGLEVAEDYMWYIEPAEAGVIITDGIEATVSWNNDFTGIANISVAGINECGYGDVSEALAVVVENTLVGVPEYLNGAFTMDIFPNPATDVLHILINGVDPKDVEIKLLDMMGRAYSSATSISNLNPGLYMVIAETGNQRVIQKLVIR